MLDFNSSLGEFFNPHGCTFDARDLCQSLVVYANQFYNYYKSGDCEIELKKEMKAKARKYELRFIADLKKKVIEELKPYSNGSKDAYYDSCVERIKEFKDACKETQRHSYFDDFFLVLDWIKDSWSWGKGNHYFECFMKFSKNEPVIIHEYGFENYAQDLGEDCYLGDIRRGNGHNPILDFIDWKGWADFVKNEYAEVSNPLNESRCVYYRSY